MSTLTQRKKVGVAGSFINQMYGNNATAPKVGEFATIMHYTDRSVVKVAEVSEDLMTVKLEALRTSADLSHGPLAMGHQCWKHEPTGDVYTIQYRPARKGSKDQSGKWCRVGRTIEFTKEFRMAMEDLYQTEYFVSKMPAEEKQELYAGEVYLQNVVEGKTKAKTTYTPLSIIFGVCDYHYDWSF
jgi:hypothetical protein